MADFRFYLNKQGIRGQKGEKGDTGFSPSIVEEVNTLTDYRLKIINEFDEFVTDNLRGSDYFDITDPNGTYLRFDKESGRAYTGALDQATNEAIGGARLASISDMETFSENTIVTPALFADSLANLIISPDGSLSITQNEQTSKTEITLNSHVFDSIRGDISSIRNDLTIESQRRESGDATLERNLNSEISTRENNFNALNTSVNQLSGDLNIEAQIRSNADGQLRSALDAERGERETQDAALQSRISSISRDVVTLSGSQTITGEKTFVRDTTFSRSAIFGSRVIFGSESIDDHIDEACNILAIVDPDDSRITSTIFRGKGSTDDLTIQFNKINLGTNELQIGNANSDINFWAVPHIGNDINNKVLSKYSVQAGNNITIERTDNGIIINSTGGGGGAIIDDGDPATNKVYSSSKTSDLVGELGNEVNSIAGRLNTLEGEVKVATTENLGLVQPDGTTITIDSDGKITAIGGGSGGMTTDTNQNVTGVKTFIGETLKVADNDVSTILAEYKDKVISTKDKSAGFTGYIEVGPQTRVLGNFAQKHFQIKPDYTWEEYYSNMIDMDGIIAGDNILLSKDEPRGEVIISADLSEVNNRIDQLELFKFPNATIEGDPTINNGQISNFSTTNYLRFPFEFKTEGRTWLLNGSFDTDSDVTIQQNIIDSLASVALAVRNGRLVLALSTNGTSFNLGEHESMSDIEPNTKYYYRLSFSGTQYLLSISTDKQEWLPEIIVTSDEPIASKPMTISSSGHPFKGTLNLNDWDLTVANTLVWQGMDDVGIASRMDVNASNVTETGKEVIREIAGVDSIDEALNLLNGGDSTLLDTKLNKDLSNLGQTEKSSITDLSFPSSRYTDLQFGATGTTYTAPASGWFSIWIGINTGGYIGLENETKFIYSEVRISSPTLAAVYVPCAKGDVIKLGYEQILGDPSFFRFIYAEGSKEDN